MSPDTPFKSRRFWNARRSLVAVPRKGQERWVRHGAISVSEDRFARRAIIQPSTQWQFPARKCHGCAAGDTPRLSEAGARDLAKCLLRVSPLPLAILP
jgi:hypothetical protein